MKSLICEGACNPHRPVVDTAVQNFRRFDLRTRAREHGEKLLPVTDEIAAQLRTLKHTPHQVLDNGTLLPLWGCEVCGHCRSFGYYFRPGDRVRAA